MTYEGIRDGVTKTVCTVWDFPTLETRFVTRRHAGLAMPDGWTVFEGAIPRDDEGSRLDVSTGKLTVGDTSFQIPDSRGSVTAWLASNDGALHLAPVIRLEGFVGLEEAEYQRTQWLYDDVDDVAGTAYALKLVNVLRGMERGLYSDFSGESFRLDDVVHAAGLGPAVTSITLSESPEGAWREPGFLALWDSVAKVLELVRYSSIGGTEDRVVTVAERRAFGVGVSTFTFPTSSDVCAVWAKRGGPVDVALEWLTTTANGPTAVEVLTNPSLEDWDDPSTPADWNLFTAGGTVSEETSIAIHGVKSAKLERTGAGDLGIALSPSLVDDKWYRLRISGRGDAGSFAVLVRHHVGLEAGNFWNGTAWVAGAADALIAECDAGSFTHAWVSFPAIYSGGVYAVSILHRGATGSTLYLDEASFVGPFDLEPNGPFDVGDGDGLGLEADLFDFDRMLSVRDELAPAPVFDVDGVPSPGSMAVLFVERSDVRDVKDWTERHCFRPFAFYPVTAADERFAIERFYRPLPPTRDIGSEWLVSKLKGGQWGRNYESRVNLVRSSTDYNALEDRFETTFDASQPTSIKRFGASKPEELLCRGGRSGRIGFPDYGSEGLVKRAAGLLLLEASNPWSEFEVSVFLKHRDLGIADAVTGVFPTIPNLKKGRRGIDRDEILVVVRRRVRRERGQAAVDLRVRVRRALLRPAIVCPNTVASTYTAASSDDRVGCYVTPGSSTTFANGDEAYTVVP